MPDFKKLYATGNPRKFIEGIVKNPARIDSDGDVAQVWFDYSFNEAGYKATGAHR